MKKWVGMTSMYVLAAMVVFFAVPFAVQAESQSPTEPVRTIPVTGSGLLEVSAGVVSNLVMKSGDLVTVPNLGARGYQAGISIENAKTLPAELPENFHFIDALSISIVKNGKLVDKLPGKSELSISFSEDAESVSCDDHSFSILQWNEVQGWVEIAANILETSSRLPGLFVLVTK